MAVLQTQQQKQFSCHCLVLYSIFLVPESKRAGEEKSIQVEINFRLLEALNLELWQPTNPAPEPINSI